MAIPDASWAAPVPPAKRERILEAARELFAREGVDAPMPALAAAVGGGVGSVYRCFPSKQGLIAALVGARYDEVAELAGEGLGGSEGEPFASLCALLWELAERQASDDLMGWAGELVADDPVVRRRRTRVTAVFGELLDL